jgi:hypothetical protein
MNSFLKLDVKLVIKCSMKDGFWNFKGCKISNSAVLHRERKKHITSSNKREQINSLYIQQIFNLKVSYFENLYQKYSFT